MSKPIRIQRRRTKGWRLPPNTVCVSRPSVWGNPYKVGCRDNITGDLIVDAAHAVRLFRERWFEGDVSWIQTMREAAQEDLRGKNLSCWCPLDQPCHADVLLEVANK